MPQPNPSPITPLLPLHVGGSDQNAIFSANGAPIGRCNYASEAAAIVHACNTLPKLEEENAYLRTLLDQAEKLLRPMITGLPPVYQAILKELQKPEVQP